ncbi:MAG: hypothetical protein RDU89_12005 [bacterium]|nr:hypothetical protein [bacterium]
MMWVVDEITGNALVKLRIPLLSKLVYEFGRPSITNGPDGAYTTAPSWFRIVAMSLLLLGMILPARPTQRVRDCGRPSTAAQAGGLAGRG